MVVTLVVGKSAEVPFEFVSVVVTPVIGLVFPFENVNGMVKENALPNGLERGSLYQV
jgi:hypothetical protein